MVIKKQNILFQWFSWHFFETSKEILKAWKNFFLFNLNYFSVLLLIRTFFSPWRRYKIFYGRSFDIGRFFEALFSNLIFRILGATIRSILIFFGSLTQIFIIFAGMIILIGWLLLPALLIVGLLFGFKILF